MARDGVAVDQQNPLVLADLQQRRDVDGDCGLSDSALGVEDDDDLAPSGIHLVDFHREVRVQHFAIARLAYVLHGGFGPDEHGLDAPAERFGRVGASEVLVVGARTPAQTHSIEGSRCYDHQRWDVAVLIVQQRIHLEGPVEVVLAVEDRYADVVPGVQQCLELVSRLHLDRRVAGLRKLRAYSGKLRGR